MQTGLQGMLSHQKYLYSFLLRNLHSLPCRFIFFKADCRWAQSIYLQFILYFKYLHLSPDCCFRYIFLCNFGLNHAKITFCKDKCIFSN
ncbi:hypothetical protein SAMN02745177_01585 [Desulforamulus hydrothermalis Lam5 = DSM 18033]|nr:hypothetical protein SAMN02745177_01585 [Desulforamulus hydrothermalis Lam5 = DSM 18033]